MSLLSSNSIRLGNDVYQAAPLLSERFENLDRWIALETDGIWRADDGGVVGEWVRNSPSLFLRQKIRGPYLWQVRVTRLRTDGAFGERFAESKHTEGGTPDRFYNFNFWLRANSRTGEFLQQYPSHLGTGWNGMGDDYWHSLFCTIVRQGEKSWSRLRRSPGYGMVVDTALPAEADYDQAHEYSFAIEQNRVRAYCDGVRFIDYKGPVPHEGHIGLCVWMCKVRFDEFRLFTLEK